MHAIYPAASRKSRLLRLTLRGLPLLQRPEITMGAVRGRSDVTPRSPGCIWSELQADGSLDWGKEWATRVLVRLNRLCSTLESEHDRRTRQKVNGHSPVMILSAKAYNANTRLTAL